MSPDISKPLFSVIIATYNCGHLIPETLDSIFAQTLQDYEIVVVDDGSTDGTGETLAPHLDHVRYERQEHKGVAAAWNTGIRASRGRYLYFLAADDWLEPQALERIATAFDAHPDVGLVALTARVMDDRGRLTGRTFGKKSPGAFYSTTSLLWGDAGCASWFAVRREVLEKVGFYDESLHGAEECDSLLRLSFETRLMNLPEPLLRYRVHGGSLSKNQLANAGYWIRILEKLAHEHPEFVEQHPWAYRRALGKELLRLGRETLAYGDGQRGWREARAHLGRSIRTFPFFRRAYVYWAWSVLAPSTFRAWRRRVQSRRLARLTR